MRANEIDWSVKVSADATSPILTVSMTAVDGKLYGFDTRLRGVDGPADREFIRFETQALKSQLIHGLTAKGLLTA